jgi:hypothetical protein
MQFHNKTDSTPTWNWINCIIHFYRVLKLDNIKPAHDNRKIVKPIKNSHNQWHMSIVHSKSISCPDALMEANLVKLLPGV